MKMFSGGLKGISALVVCWLTYLNNTFSPLFWVLLALVALDLFLNAHKEGKQFEKIGSMALSLGVPSYAAANLDNPNLGKYLIAIMCLVYLQIVIPQLMAKIASFQLSSDPKQNALDEAAIEAIVQKFAAQAEMKAQAQVAAAESPKAPEAPSVIKDGQGGV